MQHCTTRCEPCTLSLAIPKQLTIDELPKNEKIYTSCRRNERRRLLVFFTIKSTSHLFHFDFRRLLTGLANLQQIFTLNEEEDGKRPPRGIPDHGNTNRSQNNLPVIAMVSVVIQFVRYSNLLHNFYSQKFRYYPITIWPHTSTNLHTNLHKRSNVQIT